MLTMSVSAQVKQPERFETVVSAGGGFEVANAGEDGLLLFREGRNVHKTPDRLWEIIRLDTTLTGVWRKEHFLSPHHELAAKYYHDGYLHLLFRNSNPGQRDLELLTVAAATGQISHTTIRNFIPFAFHDFKVLDNMVLLSGYYNYRPVVILYDIEKRMPRVLPGIYNDKTELIDVAVNNNNTFDIVLRGRTVDKKITLFISTFDYSGNLIKKIVLDTDKSKGLLFGRSQSLGHSQLIAGVYGRRASEYSRGIFVANINEYGEQNTRYYNYGELKNFFRYMKARREQRVLKRIERRKVKNKKIRFNYRLLVHELIRSGDQYILLGEAFYPKYKTVTGNVGLFNPIWTVNRGAYQTNLLFDGYRYTHAVVLGFDKEGKLLWDNSFEINDVVSFDLKQFVQASTSGDKAVLLYVYNDAIRSKIIRGNEVLEGKEQSKIRLLHEEDQSGPEETTIGGLEKWYGNVFFTWGTQQIKNLRTQNIPLERQVFFVNKVVYE